MIDPFENIEGKLDSLTRKAMPYPYEFTPETVDFVRDYAMDKARTEFRLIKKVRAFFVVLTKFPLSPATKGHSLYTIPFSFEGHDEDEKAREFGIVRQLAAAGRAVLVATVSEVWISMMEVPQGGEPENTYDRFKRLYGQPHNDPQRIEGVQVAIHTSIAEPYQRLRFARIHRPRKARPYLDQWEEAPMSEMATGNIYSLLPNMDKETN